MSRIIDLSPRVPHGFKGPPCAGIPLVEGLVNLKDLPARSQFFAPFYAFAGIDSALARAFALVED